ncbi:hypothetical protein [Streptomyces sp. XH2]|uniref:hypothetical protein n=1 Tax=Streptomyces sp. XH2 TaxID=3412483 RepID=UPI003C7EAAB3
MNVMNMDFEKIKRRLVWWVCLALIGGAAASITAWSLYVVAHDRYGVPKPLAIGTAAVFDGAAMACLHLAGQAVRERRSALGPHLATLGMAAASVYLNRLHAELIHGGRGAFLLFAMPTVALLLLAGLSWSAHRARMRAQDGDRPATLPKLGFWGWLLATEESWERTKTEVRTHVTSPDTARTSATQPAAKPRKATEALRAHFAGMDPADAIRFAHSACPTATLQELTDELALYGVNVTPVGVGLVLGYQPPATTIERPDTSRTTPDTLPPLPPAKPLTGADILSGPPDTAIGAIRQLLDLGVTDKDKGVPLVLDALGLDDNRRDSVRRAFERELSERLAKQRPAEQPQLPLGDAATDGKGFYP